jgi:phosphoglycolate phosphatase-like HAD superfamily hydrolase
LDDIQAAKAAGVKVILIVGKESSETEVLPAGPDQRIYHFNELLSSLAKV